MIRKKKYEEKEKKRSQNIWKKRNLKNEEKLKKWNNKGWYENYKIMKQEELKGEVKYESKIKKSWLLGKKKNQIMKDMKK